MERPCGRADRTSHQPVPASGDGGSEAGGGRGGGSGGGEGGESTFSELSSTERMAWVAQAFVMTCLAKKRSSYPDACRGPACTGRWERRRQRTLRRRCKAATVWGERSRSVGRPAARGPAAT